MREIINLIESVGLANRRPGDRWQNPQGDEIMFADLTFYPESGKGSYGNKEEMTAAIVAACRERGIAPENLIWTNSISNAGGFGIAHFVDANNQDYYLGRYFKSVKPNRKENDWPNDLPGGFRLQTRAAQKERAGYKPTDILTNLVDLSPDDIYAQVVAKFGKDSDESRAMSAFMSGDGAIEIPLGNMNFDAFTNYFCEMLQPMALVMGKKTAGNAAEAEQRFLPDGGFGDCRISFGAGKTEGLTDSTVTNSAGQSIGISTKAKGGAKASAKNLDDKVQEMQATEDGRRILEQYPREISLLKMIVDGGQVGAPLNLAVLYNMITPEEAKQVRALKNVGANDLAGRLTDNLQEIYDSRSASAQAIPFYHILAAIAHRVADHVNENTDFGRVAGIILNHGAFMQAYTTATKKGDRAVLQPFNFQYPSEAVTGVLLSAGKTYYSTGLKGNFTFQILKNGATVKDVEVQDAAVDTKPDVDLDTITQQRSDIKASDTEKLSEPAALGRKRRKNF